MMRCQKFVLATMIVAPILFAAQAKAGVIPVDLAVDSTGTRTAPTDIFGTGAWANDFILDFQVTLDGLEFTYSYTVTLPSGGGGPGGDISHFTISASDGRPGTNIFLEENVFAYTGSNAIEVGFINEDQFGALEQPYGLKLDDVSDGVYTFSLTTDRSPIWGSFFAKTGSANNPTIAYNQGWSDLFGITGSPAYLAVDDVEGFNFVKTGWVPVPDSVTVPPGPGPGVVPEPTTIAIWSVLGILGIATNRRRKRNAFEM